MTIRMPQGHGKKSVGKDKQIALKNRMKNSEKSRRNTLGPKKGGGAYG